MDSYHGGHLMAPPRAPPKVCRRTHRQIRSGEPARMCHARMCQPRMCHMGVPLQRRRSSEPRQRIEAPDKARQSPRNLQRSDVVLYAALFLYLFFGLIYENVFIYFKRNVALYRAVRGTCHLCAAMQQDCYSDARSQSPTMSCKCRDNQ